MRSTDRPSIIKIDFRRTREHPVHQGDAKRGPSERHQALEVPRSINLVFHLHLSLFLHGSMPPIYRDILLKSGKGGGNSFLTAWASKLCGDSANHVCRLPATWFFFFGFLIRFERLFFLSNLIACFDVCYAIRWSFVVEHHLKNNNNRLILIYPS